MGSRRESLFESADLGLADSAEFLQGQSASVAVGGKIGRERGDAIQEGLGAGIQIEFRVAGSTWFAEGPPGIGNCSFIGHNDAA
jgi:hypothetical protein